MSEGHTSVLLSEALSTLEIAPDDVVLDATVGGAGHFSAMLSALSPEGTLIGIDADSEAIERAQTVLASQEELVKPRTFLRQENFRHLGKVLDELNIPVISKSLFDLGWSGYQLSRGRGFSFQNDEPLLMTYASAEHHAETTLPTAADVVNGTPEENLANILYEFGEEQFSRKIAKAIVEHRRRERILTTFQLVEVIKKGTPGWYHRRRLHPATKTFQALRIYVNDELGALREGLETAITRTRSEGRIVVITFHSIEDRIVKNLFRDAAENKLGIVLTKKPLVPSAEELKKNSRARSAKLRVFECSEAQSRS
ncbi:16S rRNA (cytosine(1402)-N(4))-methyltransferase RsmH [Patescibacteria group bacterium]|nr:16S rRNA (cytosine(1402)-N(4))-methyltransferase RsmH [Patescibacteria group bacterium]